MSNLQKKLLKLELVLLLGNFSIQKQHVLVEISLQYNLGKYFPRFTSTYGAKNSYQCNVVKTLSKYLSTFWLRILLVNSGAYFSLTLKYIWVEISSQYLEGKYFFKFVSTYRLKNIKIYLYIMLEILLVYFCDYFK